MSAEVAPRPGVGVLYKILSLALVVAGLTAGLTVLWIRSYLTTALYRNLEQRTFTVGQSLSNRIAGPLAVGDVFSVQTQLRQIRNRFPDIRYVLVTDPNGTVLAHTFDRAVPADLVALSRATSATERLQVFEGRNEYIFDVQIPLLHGLAGTTRIGISDQMVADHIAEVTRSALRALLFSMLIACGLAFILARILTRPLDHLVRASALICQGTFDVEAPVVTGDELGLLASSFNQMAGSLREYQRAVQEKDAERGRLIERVVLAQEEERRVIARELHDHLGQSLTAMLLSLRAHCQSPDPQRCPNERVESMIRDLIEDVHHLATGLRPAILDDYGLKSALERYVQECGSHQAAVALDFQYTEPPGLERLPAAIEVALYRIAQEAITNVFKHAGASRASVVILRRPAEVRLLVEDNGRGYNPASTRAPGTHGLGLIGIRERVALLTGAFELESSPGAGTTLQVTIPTTPEVSCPSAS